MEENILLKPKKEREIGFELLRILAMFFIICVHFLGHGGVLSNITYLYGQDMLAKALARACSVCVNLFVMITGYFLSVKKVKYKKLFPLWIEVFFYSVVIYLLFCLLGEQSFHFKSFIKVCFPIFTTQYWFFTTYFFLFLIAPFLSAMVNNISKKQHIILCVSIIILSLIISETDYLIREIHFESGYNLYWFACLFVLGSCFTKINLKVKWWGYLIMVATIGALVAFKSLSTGYASFATIVMSIMFFCLFKNIKIKSKWLTKLILIVSSATFGVYLIHENNYMRGVLYTKIFKCASFYSKPYALLAMLVCVLITFIVCTAIELLRKVLFSFAQKGLAKIYNKQNKNKQNTNVE
jgi:surface polysaccharide O-acyltransferase-like enzyme